ncbi:hypothetical protein E4U43_007291 [Claviceps pusilla]|uniref:Uncharacterized protein n=1 Tax=Claviceps pusilla TaxID=123648 RepID=A0A9P7NCU4_9HYPO|nr:hypothetical protein E4U43_007291 [Claviceps pusilla]
MGKLPEENDGANDDSRDGTNTGRPLLADLNEEDDDDRIDARNAASRLATSTF